MREIFGGRFEAFEIPERVTSGAEEFAAHVVVNANDGVALAIEVCDSFRADEAAASGDKNCLGHAGIFARSGDGE